MTRSCPLERIRAHYDASAQRALRPRRAASRSQAQRLVIEDMDAALARWTSATSAEFVASIIGQRVAKAWPETAGDPKAEAEAVFGGGRS